MKSAKATAAAEPKPRSVVAWERSAAEESVSESGDADGDEDAKYVHIRESFNESFVHRHAELVQHASVIVGLHPDEATNAIVQISLDLRRPFVVVPCCVFARRYPRKLRSGKAVSS